MKTLFICGKKESARHVDEEYDELLYVDSEPTQMVIDLYADRIRNVIRKTWKEDTDKEKGIDLYLDCPAPYLVIVENLKVVMEEDESIVFKIVTPNDNITEGEEDAEV